MGWYTGNDPRYGSYQFEYDDVDGNEDWEDLNQQQQEEIRKNNRPFWMTAADMFPEYQGPKALDAQFQANWKPIQGGSVWEKNMLAKQALESQGAMDRMRAANSSNWATARSGMAMRGGIDQGARERLAANAARTGIMNAQEQSRLDQMARIGIGAEGEKQRIALEQYNNQGALDTSKWNIANAIRNGQSANEYNLGRNDILMRGMAADREAVAKMRS